MSNMKNGFSTLNRWLGKKNKDNSSVPNGKLSKSNTNLSISTTNINDTSQREYNRIAPLPAITTNAPFEQTFRITVLLPKDQLYVTRLGARVPLSKLLELACDHKSLDPEKYEFRNPVDASQVYSCDLTIGFVGLSEIRLCHKSDSYDNFNADEVMKLHRTSVIRDSLSSSEFSSRNSKHTTKTASPYSSSNSLNSMDSTGMNYTRTPVSLPPALPKTAPPTNVSAPPRKKRLAPRPPSQIVIPEKSALVIEQEASKTEETIETLKKQQKAMSSPTRKDFYASTPNLTTTTTITTITATPNIDTNGNSTKTGKVIENGIGKTSTNGIYETNGNTIEYSDSEYAQIVKKNARNLHGGSMLSLPAESLMTADANQLPEPSPRKRITLFKKKVAPAPPPRASSIPCSEDNISSTSTTPSTPTTPIKVDSMDNNIKEQQQSTPPQPLAREASLKELRSSTPKVLLNIPTPVPRQTTTTLLNATTTTIIQEHTNVSKVLLNRSPTPEPRSLASDSSETVEHIMSMQQAISNDNDDNISKQADSGIGEPVPSPIPDSLPSEGSTHECKSTFESSSDDDEMIKTYNFKLGKTIVTNIDIEPIPPQSLEELHALQVDSAEVTPIPLTNENMQNIGMPSSWNFAIPISPPPTFADENVANHLESSSTDTPITPIIVERPILNFDTLSTVKRDVVDHSSAVEVETHIEKSQRRSTISSPTSPINEIIDELSTILNENRVDTLIKRHNEQHEIQSAKPNTLTNFTISTITTQQVTTTTEPTDSPPATPDSTTDEEKLYKKRGSISNGNVTKRKSITRADSFHTTSNINCVPNHSSTIVTSTTTTLTTDLTNGLNTRSASYLSLPKLDQNGGLNQKRSSSELSIGESPSLQSLEVIKTILNSRKNSLANSSDGESKVPNIDIISVERKTVTEESKIMSVELKPTKSENPKESNEDKKSKETPKVYRYSGPPSINFSTWSERPKVQVAIKNEGDYIFGGRNANNQNAAVTRADVELRNTQTMPRQQRATMHVTNSEVTKSPPVIAPKPSHYSTTERMGIPEKDFHVPVTVKPLKDVTIENVEIRTKPNVSKIMINSTATGTATVTKTTTASTNKQQQYAQVSNNSNTSTLPRVGHNTNRFSIPAKQSIGVNLLRSTSITQLEQRHSIQNDTTTVNAAPFGQNTLRKTGLKEKILAKDDQDQDQTLNHRNDEQIPKSNLKSNNIIQIETRSILKNGIFPKPSKAQLKSPTEISIKNENGIVTTPTSIASTPKSAPPAPVPPVLPMPILKSVAIRSQSTPTATSPVIGDQRDALLDAIRNFKRTELNRI